MPSTKTMIITAVIALAVLALVWRVPKIKGAVLGAA